MNLNRSIWLGNFRTNLLTILLSTLASAGLVHSQIEYSSDFESLDVQSPSALSDASWTAYTNVFSSAGGYLYGYSPTSPPIGGGGYWGVTTDQAGPAQGVQSLVIYSDYYNQNAQTAGNRVEANVFQQFPIFLEDAGTYEFRFDAKAGNLEATSAAQAFIKVLDPSAGYATVASVTLNTSALPTTWASYAIRLDLDESMEDMILQIGFSATASNNLGSGVIYDNIDFGIAPAAVPADPVITQVTKVGNVVNISFPSDPGASYDLFKSTDGMASFQRVETQAIIPGDGSSKVATDPSATESSAFYRIRRQQ
jgi:hypothetical protein